MRMNPALRMYRLCQLGLNDGFYGHKGDCYVITNIMGVTRHNASTFTWKNIVQISISFKSCGKLQF